MKKYRTLLINWKNIESLSKILNEYAEEGWIVKTSTSNNYFIIIILEKEIENK